jgi:hypothetical protein
MYSPELDADVEFRTGRRTTGGWVHCMGTTAALREHVVLDDSFSIGFGGRAGFEQWFGLNPAPRRIFSGPAMEFAVDGNFDDGYWRWPNDSQATTPLRYEAFPLQRLRVISGRATLGIDAVRIDGFSSRVSGPGDPVPEVAVRPWTAFALGFFFVSVEPGYAATVVFGRGDVDHEAWIHIGIGRPLWPFSGHIGYRYHGADRFRAHYLSIGFQALF